MGAELELLHRCTPRECNSATGGGNPATARATVAQRTSLKALAMQALGRNNERNDSATDAGKGAQQHPVAEPPAVARLVTCETCSHFVRNSVNPAAGVGACGAGVGHLSIGRALHPMAPRYCTSHHQAADMRHVGAVAQLQLPRDATAQQHPVTAAGAVENRASTADLARADALEQFGAGRVAGIEPT